MSSSEFSDDFKRDAVAQIAGRSYSVREVSGSLAVIPYSLCASIPAHEKCLDIEHPLIPSTKSLRRPVEPTAAYLAVVIDLCSRRVIGWCLQGRQTTDALLQVLLMAVWRRKPKARMLIHSPSRDVASRSPEG